MKKLPKTILKEFEELRSIRSNDSWKQETKQQLLSELDFSGSKKTNSFFSLVTLYFQESVKRLSLKPVGALILIAGVIIGPGIATVSAARSSLPGDTLYPLKRSLENVELSFAFSEKKRAEIEITQVANRLAELNRITQEQVPSPERKQKLVLAVEEVKKGTETVKKRLESNKQEKNSDKAEEAIEIAKIIEEKTASYKEDLKTSVKQLSDEVAEDADDIQLALSAVQEVAIDALNIIAEDHEEGGENITKEDLKESVEEQLTTIKEQIAVLNGQEEPASTEEASEDETTDESTEEATEEEGETAEETESSQDQELSDEHQKELDEQIQYIEELIEMGKFKTALDQLSETKNQLDQMTQDKRAEKESAKEAQEEEKEIQEVDEEANAEEEETVETTADDSETQEGPEETEAQEDESAEKKDN